MVNHELGEKFNEGKKAEKVDADIVVHRVVLCGAGTDQPRPRQHSTRRGTDRSAVRGSTLAWRIMLH